MITALQAAKIFIDKSLQEGEKPVSHKQVQKMIYFLHGWGHVKLDKQIINEEPQAWRHGPVYVSVWDALKQWKFYYITKTISGVDPVTDGTITPLLNEIYEGCSKYSADYLSDITHEEGSPWHEVYVIQDKHNGTITDDSIKKNFVDSYNAILKKKNGASK